MNPFDPIPASRDKLLFTPGPLTTSLAVKSAMLHDAGSWHFEFNSKVRAIRTKLLEIAQLERAEEYEAILMQGSGTFGVESVIGSTVPPGAKLLVISNGAYGERAVAMAERLKIPHRVVRSAETEPPDLAEIEAALAEDREIASVFLVHCETTTGIVNPLDEIGRVVRSSGRRFIVDAMSSFGALRIDIEPLGIDYLVSSPNKCLESVPGFSFVIARRAALSATEGFARSLSLDLLGQWRGFEKNGQFRYTPPTHAILAFEQALREFEAEGGLAGRSARYEMNHRLLVEGMARLGFKPVLRPEVQSCLITSFFYPDHSAFQFDSFYRLLSDQGMIIYPGKLTRIDCFRIGTIGRIFESDIRCLVAAVGEALVRMGIRAA